MLDCPSCGAETSKLIGCNELRRVVCTNCHYNCMGDKKFDNYNLGQTLIKDKNGTRVTYGKAFEIDNRMVCPDDGKTIINRKTGKPAQY